MKLNKSAKTIVGGAAVILLLCLAAGITLAGQSPHTDPQPNTTPNIAPLPTTIPSITPIHLIFSKGTIVAWGNNEYGQCNVPTNLSNVTAIAAGWCYSLALKDDGTVVAWGRLLYPPHRPSPKYIKTVPPIPDWLEGCKIRTVAAGPYHNIAIVETCET